MKATTIKLELIGDNWYTYAKLLAAGRIRHPRLRDEITAIRYGDKHYHPWVAQVIGTDEKFGFARRFVQPIMNDYSHADKMGERGIYAWYALEPGIYEINECLALGRARRYFCRIGEDCLVVEMGRDEVLQCLNAH